MHIFATPVTKLQFVHPPQLTFKDWRGASTKQEFLKDGTEKVIQGKQHLSSTEKQGQNCLANATGHLLIHLSGTMEDLLAICLRRMTFCQQGRKALHMLTLSLSFSVLCYLHGKGFKRNI